MPLLVLYGASALVLPPGSACGLLISAHWLVLAIPRAWRSLLQALRLLTDDEDGGEGEEFVAAAAVDVQVGVEEAVLVEKDDRQAVMPEEPVKIVALGVAFVVPPSRRRRGSLCPL